MSSRPIGTAVARADGDQLRLGEEDQRLRVALVAALVGLVVFGLIQSALAAYNIELVRTAVERGWLTASPFSRADWAGRLGPSLLTGSISYLALSLVGAVIAGRGHRVVFAFPAMAFGFTSVIPWPHHPQAVGPEWTLECFGPGVTCRSPWFGHPWLGPLVDLALVLLPGWLVSRSVTARRWPGRTDEAAVAALLTTVAIVATAWWTLQVIEPYVDPVPLAMVATVGIVLGVARPWWPWLQILFATFAAGSLWLVLEIFSNDGEFSVLDALPYELAHLWPIVLIGLIATPWQPLAALFRFLQGRRFGLIVAVNALNLVDAAMTQLAVTTGGAYESNPLIRFAGLPAKVVLVATLTWLLYRRKPSALIWPAAVFLGVAGYHFAGILVNGWR